MTNVEHLGSDELEVELLPEVGGRVHRIRAFGFDLLRTPPDPRAHGSDPFFWGSYPMVPWCNRVPGGVIALGERRVVLPVNYGGHAIHGEAYARPWQLVGDQLIFAGGSFGFPWRYEARQRFTVSNDVFTLELSVANLGDDSMPAALGIHPWFNASTRLMLRVPADAVYRSDRAGVAVGVPVPPTPHEDLSRAARPRWGLDSIFTHLLAREVSLHWPDVGVAATLRFTEDATHVAVAAFEDVGAVAVEPQTSASDAFGRLARAEIGAARLLEPGGTLRVTYSITVRPERAER